MRPNRFTTSLLACVIGALAMSSARGSSRSGPADTQRVYVTVVDAKGKPVLGLTKDDFTVKLDAKAQEVLDAAPATEPLSVLILTDRLGLNSTYSPFDVGQALGDFVKSLRKSNQGAQFAVTTFDGPVIQVAQFTTALAVTQRALERLSTNSEDAVLLDGLLDASKSMRSAPTDRRVIFALLAAYRPDRSTLLPEVMGDVLRTSGASLWAVEVRQPQGGNYSNPAREQVLDAGSALSGGLRDVVASRSGVTTATKRVADLILAQYAITYGPGGGTARSELVVQVTRPEVRVLAPHWMNK